jgi:hypothetical protein
VGSGAHPAIVPPVPKTTTFDLFSAMVLAIFKKLVKNTVTGYSNSHRTPINPCEGDPT